MRKREFTAGMDESLIAGYRSGELIDSIMRRLDIGRGPLYRRHKELGEPAREPNKASRRGGDVLRPYTQASRLVYEVLCAARDEWFGMPELARRAGMCPESIHIWNRGQGDVILKNLEAVGQVVGKRLIWIDVPNARQQERA